jgi:hypothetical protein
MKQTPFWRICEDWTGDVTVMSRRKHRQSHRK